MGLKDWKKREPEHTGESGHIIYKNLEGQELHVYKISSFGRRARWYVEKMEKYIGKEKTIFKGTSKSSALEFAKQYMGNY